MEKRTKGYENKHKRIDSFGELKANWDNRGAITISTNAIKNTNDIVSLYEWFEFDISEWSFNPGVCGEVLIDYKGDNALSNFLIHDSEFSYFIEFNGEPIKGTANAEFNKWHVFSLMRYVEYKNAAK